MGRYTHRIDFASNAGRISRTDGDSSRDSRELAAGVLSMEWNFGSPAFCLISLRRPPGSPPWGRNDTELEHTPDLIRDVEPGHGAIESTESAPFQSQGI